MLKHLFLERWQLHWRDYECLWGCRNIWSDTVRVDSWSWGVSYVVMHNFIHLNIVHIDRTICTEVHMHSWSWYPSALMIIVFLGMDSVMGTLRRHACTFQHCSWVLGLNKTTESPTTQLTRTLHPLHWMPLDCILENTWLEKWWKKSTCNNDIVAVGKKNPDKVGLYNVATILKTACLNI